MFFLACWTTWLYIIIGTTIATTSRRVKALSFSFPWTGFQVLLDASTATSSPSLDSELRSSFLADGWIISGQQQKSTSKNNNNNVFIQCQGDPYQDSKTKEQFQGAAGTVANVEYRRRRGSTSNDKLMRIWMMERQQMQQQQSIQMQTITTTDQSEAFCFHGDYAFCHNGINSLVPAGSLVLWKPNNIENLDELLMETWRLRSAGCLGMILDLERIKQRQQQDDGDAQYINSFFRKLKRPCSAMDYPPTIYMVGEDESETGAY